LVSSFGIAVVPVYYFHYQTVQQYCLITSTLPKMPSFENYDENHLYYEPQQWDHEEEGIAHEIM